MSCSADEDKLIPGDEFSFMTAESCYSDLEFGDGVSAVLKSLSLASSSEWDAKAATDNSSVDIMVGQFEDKLATMQNKFNSLYTHCCNLADELEEKDEALALMKKKLSWLRRGDKAQQDLCETQKILASSTLALASREQKTKFITWNLPTQ